MHGQFTISYIKTGHHNIWLADDTQAHSFMYQFTDFPLAACFSATSVAIATAAVWFRGSCCEVTVSDRLLYHSFDNLMT